MAALAPAPLQATDALNIVDRLLITIQRMRSLAFEQEGDAAAAQRMLSHLAPYVHGPKCLLPLLARIQDRGFVTAPELYNLLFIAHTLEPSIALNADLTATSAGLPALPHPDAQWLRFPWPVPASV